jgi:hypothetical protein
MQGQDNHSPLTEIARSFSYKLNVGNYESRDFFCSQKSECTFDDAEAVSKALHDFCRKQVMAAVREYQEQANAEAAKLRAGR